MDKQRTRISVAGREKRKHWRVAENNAVIFTVMAAGDSDDRTGKQYICSTVDVSVIGMRITCRESLPKGALLQLMLAIKEPPCSFALKGKVRWARKDEELGKYHAGVQFIDNDVTVMKKWQALIRTKLPKNAESEMKGGFAPDDDSAW